METFSFEEIGAMDVTFGAQSTVREGHTVTMITHNEVSGCLEGAPFIGVARVVNNTVAGVQMCGFVTVSYSGTLNVGLVGLVADGKGGVQEGDSLRRWVISVDEEAKTAVIFL